MQSLIFKTNGVRIHSTQKSFTTLESISDPRDVGGEEREKRFSVTYATDAPGAHSSYRKTEHVGGWWKGLEKQGFEGKSFTPLYAQGHSFSFVYS